MAAEGEDMKTRERESGDGEEKETDKTKTITVKTLDKVTRYNRIFNIRHKIAGNGSVSIKIPSL